MITASKVSQRHLRVVYEPENQFGGRIILKDQPVVLDFIILITVHLPREQG